MYMQRSFEYRNRNQLKIGRGIYYYLDTRNSGNILTRLLNGHEYSGYFIESDNCALKKC